MLDVYFYEAFQEEAAALKRLLPEKCSAGFTDKTIQESCHSAPPARVISVRTQSQLPLSWADQLDAILSRSTGYDHLLVFASRLNTTPGTNPCPALGYLPLYCHRAVAEQTMLVWMSLLRRLPKQIRQFHDFRRDGLTGSESQGRTLLVVGVGNIGHEVCKLGRAIGMHVLGVDRDTRHSDVQYVELNAGLSQADVIVCAMDLNAKNSGYFAIQQWQHAKPGAIFVNISRGELSPSCDLIQALDSGLLGGVGLDVYNRESLLATSLRNGNPSDDPEVSAALALSKRDDCICTPHNAFNTIEAVERKSEHSVQQIVAFLEQKKFLWPVLCSES